MPAPSSIPAIVAWCKEAGYPVARLHKTGILPISYHGLAAYCRANKPKKTHAATELEARIVLRFLKGLILPKAQDRRIKSIDAAILRYKRGRFVDQVSR